MTVSSSTYLPNLPAHSWSSRSANQHSSPWSWHTIQIMRGSLAYPYQHLVKVRSTTMCPCYICD